MDLHAGVTVYGSAGVKAVILSVRDATDYHPKLGALAKGFREVIYQLTVDGQDMGVRFMPEGDFRRDFRSLEQP